MKLVEFSGKTNYEVGFSIGMQTKEEIKRVLKKTKYVKRPKTKNETFIY